VTGIALKTLRGHTKRNRHCPGLELIWISVLPSFKEQLLSQAAEDTAAAMLMEARGLLLRGWSKGAQARDVRGHVVNAWSDEAASWSLVGALLASWHRHDDRLDADFVAHSAEARALADATDVVSRATGTLALDPWNDATERNRGDVIAAVDRALALLDHSQAEAV
jgi:hypothetical protein